MELRDYQKQGVKFLQERKYALLADDVGLGKSAQCLHAIYRYGVHGVLIICPATVKECWKNQIKLWMDEKDEWLTEIVQNSGHKFDVCSRFTIVNYELINRKDRVLFKKLMNMRFSTIICDEAHKLKNVATKRTRRILDPRGLISRTDKLWFVTGTPIKNRPIDLYSLISSTVPELIKPYDTYLKFAYQYCAAFEGKYCLDVSGASNEQELADRIAPFMLRREQHEVLKELPEALVDTIELECTPEAKKIIQEEEERTVELAGERDIELFTLGETARIRQALAKYKIKESLPFITDLMEETNKIVIFYHHTSVLKALLKSLSKMNPVYINGTIPAAKRLGIVEQFNTDPRCRVFIGQMQACGEGLDGLQHSSHTCVFVEPSWSPTDITQCIGRLKRFGQTYMVSVYILVIKATLEATMMGTAKWKQKVMNKIITKTDKEKQMYLEERIEKLEEATLGLAASIKTLVKALTSGGQAEPDAEAEAAPKKTAAKNTAKKTEGRKTNAPAAKRVEPIEEDVEVTLDMARALAGDICVKYPKGVGKKRCIAIVAANGGTKLDTLEGEGLQKCHDQFVEILEGDDSDV